MKSESQGPQQPFTGRFQVPIPIAQAPGPQQTQAVPVPPSASQTVTQAMSPNPRPLRAPVPFGYPERDNEPPSAPQPPARMSQKPAAVSATMVSEPGQQRAAFAADVDAQLSQLAARRQRERMELQQREESRHAERQQSRLKQEDVPHHYEAFPPPQASSRLPPARNEPVSFSKQADQRPVAPAIQAYPPVQQQPVGTLLGESASASRAGALDHAMSGTARPISTPVQDPYKAPTPQPQRPSVAPAPSRAPERKTSSLMALLNDDPAPAPAPPKRVNDVSTGLKSSSTPPPQSMTSRHPPPQTAPPPLRREAETPFSPYSRNPPPPQAAIPSLKPYNTSHSQSPQSQPLNTPRSSLVSPIDPVVTERDYYARNPYQPQHQNPSTNSPQTHPYPAPTQQSQMGYQPQPSYQGYSSQPPQSHSASPTPQYAAQSSAPGRREPLPPSSREPAWPPPQSQNMASATQQQAAWPSNQGAPKTSQPPPQSPWASQHGASKPPPVSSGMQPQSSWSSAAPQSAPHYMGLREVRDERGVYQVHDARSPMVQYQHSGSHGGRYPPTPVGRNEVPPPAQPPYPRYTSTPGPGQSRDPLPGRSYTPVSAYDPRGPPPGAPYTPQDQMRDMQMRDMGRDPRDMGRDPRDPAQQPPPSILQRQLRPHDDFSRPQERYR